MVQESSKIQMKDHDVADSSSQLKGPQTQRFLLVFFLLPIAYKVMTRQGLTGSFHCMTGTDFSTLRDQVRGSHKDTKYDRWACMDRIYYRWDNNAANASTPM